MAGRTSARSSASRDQASSPPKKTGQRASTLSQSPAMRSTRSTRSQSRDPHADEDLPAQKPTRSRRARQSSVDSTGSVASITSADGTGRGKGKGTRKNTRAAEAATAELSMVAEDQESEGPNEDVELDEEAEKQQRLQSPGGLSNMSGTTALTSHSQQEMGDLDPDIIVETLEDLSRTSSQLLHLLIPSTLSQDVVESAVKELQIPGSTLGKRLNLKEKAFDSYKTAYGSDLFINASYILRKLFHDRPPAVPTASPEPILQEANIAILAKMFLVAQRDSPETEQILQLLDDSFPDPFITNYKAEPEDGGSTLVFDAFELALDVRTQYLISVLRTYKNEPGYEPDAFLAQIFLEPPTQRDESLSRYEDSYKNGQCRSIGGITADAFSEDELNEYVKLVRERIRDIRTTFLDHQDAIMDGDRVDFEGLYEEYSWTAFLTRMMDWSRSRLNEIQRSIEKKGGIQNIVESLDHAVQSFDGSAKPPNVAHLPQPSGAKKRLQPPAEIIPASINKSLYQSSKSVAALLRPPPTSSLPPSNQQQRGAPIRRDLARNLGLSRSPVTPRDQMSRPREPATAPAKITNSMRRRQVAEASGSGFMSVDDFNEAPRSTQERTTGELLGEFFESENEKNKENRPIVQRGNMSPPRRRFIDPQKNAQRVSWTENEDTQQEDRPQNRQKRKHQDFDEEVDHDNDEENEDEEEEEDAYQQDERTVDPSRRQRLAVSAETSRLPVQPRQPSPKRARLQTREETLAERTRQYNVSMQAVPDEPLPDEALQDAALQASARADGVEDEEENADGEDVPSGTAQTYQDVKEYSKDMTKIQVATHNRKIPRKRKPWSTEEENALIHYVGLYGSQWSHILTQGRKNFPTRDQVALKDKARNMKVDYLKTGSILPLKFDQVALGAKEIRKVKDAGYNPYRLEGEEVGEESIETIDSQSSPSPSL